MIYRNIVTGIEVDFKSPVSGENWEPVEAPKVLPEAENEKETGKAVKSGGRGKKKLRDGQ